MTPWNLDRTREHVLRRYGDNQLQVVRKCLESIIDRQRYAGYHFHEHMRLLEEHIDAKLPSTSIYKVTLPLDAHLQADLDFCLTRVSANIVACVQSMHSLADILAHVIYFASGLNLQPRPLSEQAIYIHTVAKRLSADDMYYPVTEILEEIAGNSDFVYLSALVNHSKHRSIVGTVLSVDPPADGRPPYVLLFDEFSYKGMTYERRPIQPYLEPTYSWLSSRIVDCGNALNSVLEESKGASSN